MGDKPYGAQGSLCPRSRGNSDSRLIVRRAPPSPGSQLALFAACGYHVFICDRAGDTLALEADHRRHAEIENTIRDLKYGVGLNHLPLGKFGVNAAWLAFQVMARNLGLWVGRLGLRGDTLRMKTLRSHYLYLLGRLTRSARRLFLALPAGLGLSSSTGRLVLCAPCPRRGPSDERRAERPCAHYPPLPPPRDPGVV